MIITDSDTLSVSFLDDVSVYNLGPSAPGAYVTMEFDESLVNGNADAIITMEFDETLVNGNADALVTMEFDETLVNGNPDALITFLIFDIN